MKKQRETKNLGTNTISTRDSVYDALTVTHSKCTDSLHEGERMLPVRNFYLRGDVVQAACIECQTRRRKMRIDRCRTFFEPMTPCDIRQWYTCTYGDVKKCSMCGTEKHPREFRISKSMECGLHNLCIDCSVTYSKNHSVREYIFMPDKDGALYKKRETCERCGSTEKLAVDHIVPISRGGVDMLVNKQTLCVHCNSRKSNTLERIPENPLQICERYRDGLDFTLPLGQFVHLLSRRVYEFRHMYVERVSLVTLKRVVQVYKTTYNLGDDIDRIVRKISLIFGNS